MIRGGK